MNCNPCVEHQLEQPTKRLNSNEILNSVCNFYGMSPSLVCGKLRFKNIVEARMVAAYVLRRDRYLSLGLKHIGSILGGKDHTTIMHLVKRMGELIEIEPDLRDKVRNVFLQTYGNTNYFKD
jgi:chromosomal replication initiator protein